MIIILYFLWKYKFCVHKCLWAIHAEFMLITIIRSIITNKYYSNVFYFSILMMFFVCYLKLNSVFEL